jgi:hypothetical protein
MSAVKSVLVRKQPWEVHWKSTCENLTCELKTLCVIITVTLKVLQLFVITTSEDPINPTAKPNPRLSQQYTRQYQIPVQLIYIIFNGHNAQVV